MKQIIFLAAIILVAAPELAQAECFRPVVKVELPSDHPMEVELLPSGRSGAIRWETAGVEAGVSNPSGIPLRIFHTLQHAVKYDQIPAVILIDEDNCTVTIKPR